MTRALMLTVLLALLAAMTAPIALAQPHGPPPGYTDPVAYAQDYGTGQVGQATSDPVGYVTGKATPDNATAEAEHAAWLACWTKWSQTGVDDPACDLFFTPPQHLQGPTKQDVQGHVTSIKGGVNDFANTTLDAVNQTVAHPTSAVDQVLRVAGAAVGLVLMIIGMVLHLLGLGGLGVLAGLHGGVLGLLGMLGLAGSGLQLASHGIGLGVSSLTGGVTAIASALAGAAVAGASGFVQGLQLTGHGVSLGASTVGSSITGSAHAAAQSVHDTSRSVSEAAQAAVQAVKQAAHDLAQQVSSLFGHSASGKAGAAQDPGSAVSKATDGAGGLVHRNLSFV